jgi:hypothetical protein
MLFSPLLVFFAFVGVVTNNYRMLFRLCWCCHQQLPDAFMVAVVGVVTNNYRMLLW